jgi:hypothetical protein
VHGSQFSAALTVEKLLSQFTKQRSINPSMALCNHICYREIGFHRGEGHFVHLQFEHLLAQGLATNYQNLVRRLKS